MRYALFASLLLGTFCAAKAAETQGYPTSVEDKNFSRNLREIVLKDSPDSIEERLYKILEHSADAFKGHDNFSDKDSYTRSLNNWRERCRYLKSAISMGSKEAKKTYERELESKKYSLECYDCLIAGYEDTYDPKMVLGFYWEQVAQEIPSEREKLNQAYAKGIAVSLENNQS